MKPITLMLAVVGIAAATIVGVATIVADGSDNDDLDADVSAQLDGLASRLDDMNERHRRIERRLNGLEARPVPTPRDVSSGLTADDVQAMIADAVNDAAAEPAADTDELFDLDDTMVQLLARDLDYAGRQALWDRIRKSGRIDEVLAKLEERAKIEENNPEAQADLGDAYIQKLTAGDTSQQEIAGLAGKADAAYDTALGLDEGHWRARFSKAVALTFWPDFLGKRPIAVKNFELLVEQQSQGESLPGHVQTYLFLGNLYEQMNRQEAAAAMWQQGLDRFPGNETLASRLNQ